MRLKSIRIKKWRILENKYKNEEMKDICKEVGFWNARKYNKYIPPRTCYEKWILSKEKKNQIDQMPVKQVFFSVYIHTDNTVKHGITEKSVRKQAYQNFKIYYMRNGETPIKAQGDYLIFLQEGKHCLAMAALRVLNEKILETKCDILYSDQDELDIENGIRRNPFFKPDWSPDTMSDFFYIKNLTAYKNDGQLIPPINIGQEFDQWLYDYTKNRILSDIKIEHIQEILCHELEPYDYTMPLTKAKRTSYGHGKVIVIIPSKDHSVMLEKCIKSLNKYSLLDHKWQIEIVVVDNGSSPEEKNKIQFLSKKYSFNYVYQPMDFNFSVMCNIGAEKATGDYLLFLNDDVEAFERGWLDEMLLYAQQPHVGAVGAKLYYPNSRKIQHAGVINYVVGPGHCFLQMEDNKDLYFGRTFFNYNVLAVTGACMLIRKDLFFEIGGFDEHLAIGYNDVDVCFSLYEHGYYNVQCNSSRLYHHESLSRGYDEKSEEKGKRLKQECQYLYEKHPDLKGRDPFYNVNLTGYLPDFDLDVDYYGWPSEKVPRLPESEVRPIYWDIRSEWLNPLFKLQVDCVTEQDSHITVRGWSYLEKLNNDCYIRSLLIKNNAGKCYCIGIRSCYKRYLKERFPNVKGMEMLGFTCDFSRKSVVWDDGDYVIGMMAENKKNNDIYMIFTNTRIRANPNGI